MFKSRGFAILHSGLRMAGMIEILVVRKEA
jgi:hypothetical protein